MTIIKSHLCKSCGGLLDIDIDRQVYICPFCGITYDYEYFREENVLDIANRAMNRNEFGSAKEAFDFILQKDPHNFEALRGILLCNSKWQTMAPFLNSDKVFLKENDPTLLMAIENSTAENKDYFSSIKNALSRLYEYRRNSAEITRLTEIRDADRARLNSLYMSKRLNEEKFTQSARNFFAEMADYDMIGLMFSLAVAIIVGIIASGIYISWWVPVMVLVLVLIVVAIYSITKAITSNTLDAAIAPVKEKVDKMDKELEEKRKYGEGVLREYQDMAKKIIATDMKLHKTPGGNNETGEEATFDEDELDLEL